MAAAESQDGSVEYLGAAWPHSSGKESLRRDRFHHMVRHSSLCPLPAPAKHGLQRFKSIWQ